MHSALRYVHSAPAGTHPLQQRQQVQRQQAQRARRTQAGGGGQAVRQAVRAERLHRHVHDTLARLAQRRTRRAVNRYNTTFYF